MGIKNGTKLTSLPVRECGLKLRICSPLFPLRLSLPVRECGLKLTVGIIIKPYTVVTPRAGVWIETVQSLLCWRNQG